MSSIMSHASCRRTRHTTLVLVVAIAIVAIAALHTAAGAAPAARLAARFARTQAKPAQPLTDRRWHIQWAYANDAQYPSDACTRELNGTTHAVISEEQWPRINFSPVGATVPCSNDGGPINGVDGDGYYDNGNSWCYAACKMGFGNADPAAADGISRFTCLHSQGEGGLLSGGPECFGPTVVGLAEGQGTGSGDSIAVHVELKNGLKANISDLTIGWTCSNGHTTSASPFTITVGANVSTTETLSIANNNGGSCNFTYSGGDARFTSWTQTISFVGPSLTAKLAEGSVALTNSDSHLVLTASNAVATGLTVNVACTNPGESVGTLASSSFTFADTETEQTIVYTAVSTPTAAAVAVTCTFTPVAGGDARYSSLIVPDFVFSVARPTLTVSGISAGQLLLINSQAALNVTASVLPSGAVTVTPTCSSGTIDPATFEISSGSPTASLTFTAPAVAAPISCTFAVSASADARFGGVEEVLSFSVDVPIAMTAVAANPFLEKYNPVTLMFSRRIQGSLQVNSVLTGTYPTAPDSASSLEVFAASGLAGTTSSAQTWSYYSGDTRYVGTSATVGPRPFLAQSAFVMTPSAATGSAPLIAGRQHGMTVTLAHAAFGGLQVTPTCNNGASVVGSFSPAQLIFADGATIAQVNYTAPSSFVASLVCSFTKASGDYRYTNTTVSLPALQVIVPTMTLAGTVNGTRPLTDGDQLFVGDDVALTVTVAPVTESALVLSSSHNGVPAESLTVDSGATTAQLGFTLMAAGPSAWSFAYESGDDRFAGVNSGSLSFSAELVTLAASVTNGSTVAASSQLSVTLAASHAVRESDVVVHIACSSGASTSGSFRVHVGQTESTTTTVTLPAAAAANTTVTCALAYDRGDVRYSYARAPAFFVVVPAIVPADSSSSSSTGESGSDSSTGSGGGASSSSSTGSGSTGLPAGGASSSTPGACADDVECAATPQAAGGFAVLALAAAAAAFALGH